MTQSTSREVFFLRQVSQQKYSEDFSQNLIQVNNTLKSVSKYLITMQQGIDDLNRDIIQVIQDFINEIIIIFGGGSGGDSGFQFGDLKYIFQALGSLFGFGDIGEGFDLLEIAGHFFQNFLAPLQPFVDTVENFVQSLFGILFGFLEDVPFIGDFIQSIAAAMNKNKTKIEEVESVVVETQTTVVQIQEIFSVISSRSLADGPDPTGESTFRYENMQLQNTRPGTNTSNVSFHEHQIPSLQVGYPAITLTQSITIFGWVRQGLVNAKQQATFIAFKSGEVTDFRMQVHVMDRGTGVVTRMHTSPNLAVDLLGVAKWMQISFPSYTPEMGDIVGGEFWMAGSGSVSIAGVELIAPQALPGFRPAQIGAVKPNGSLLGGFNDFDMMSWASGLTPYIQFGSDVGQVNAKRSYIDTFNRGALGPNWIVRTQGSSERLGITSNRMAHKANQLLPTYSDAQWIQPLATDAMAVQADFTNIAGNIFSALTIGANSSFDRFVNLTINGDMCAFYTTVNNKRAVADWVIHNHVTGMSVMTEAQWRLEYDPDDNIYLAKRNGSTVNTWPDNTHIMQHGTGNRYAGAGINHEFGGSGSRIDNWRAWDL